MLFFLLNSLNKIHAFYQFSLNAFVTVFSRGLDHAPGGRKKKGPRRSASLKDAVSCFASRLPYCTLSALATSPAQFHASLPCTSNQCSPLY